MIIDDPINLQAITPKQQLGNLLKGYLNDLRLFTAALEELQGQLSKIESELSRSKSKPSDVMKGVLENANTLKFKQYIEGSLPPPPQPDLATGIDENIRLLSVLCSEMNKFVGRIESLEEILKSNLQTSFERHTVQQQREEEEEQQLENMSKSTWQQAANDALLAAATVDALKQDIDLIRKVTEAVSILTPSAEISSYVTILNVQPYFPSMPDNIDASMLAEGLSGIALCGFISPLLEASNPSAAAAVRSAPIASVSPLLVHLEQVVDGVLQTAMHGESQNIDAQATKIKGLTFAIASSVGTFWRLDTHDEDVLWHLSTKLWNASLNAFQSSEDENPTADLLHALGSDIFQVITGDSFPAVAHVSHYIEFLCKMGREWDRLGNQNRSSWCISHAVVYAKRLEALMSAEELPANIREQCVLQLFNLYLQAARESNKSVQQSLANNMLAKALQLSKQHEILLPQTVAEMALGLAELQLEQARTLLQSDGHAAALVLFAAAEKHVEDALPTLQELENTTNANSIANFDYQQLQIKAEQMRVDVLVATAQAHLTAGEPALASKKLESLKTYTTSSNSHPFENKDDLFCTVGCCLVEMHLALQNVQAAAKILTESAHRSASPSVASPGINAVNTASPPQPRHSNNMFKAWMQCFENVLHAIPQPSAGTNENRVAAAGAVADAALAWIYSAASSKHYEHVEDVLQCLLGSEGKEDISLKVLATNEVIAIIVADSKLQAACFSMLLTLASQHFLAGSNEKCASVLTAALQYAQQTCKAKTAELLAATHLRLNNKTKSLEYLDIARMHRIGNGITSMGALVEVGAVFASNNVAQSQKALHSLRQCPDFYVETAQAAVQIAQLSVDPGNAADVAAMAIQSLIPLDNTPSPMAPGQECDLLSIHVHALLQNVIVIKYKIKLKESASSEYLQHTLTKTMESLVSSLKLSTKRLKVIGIGQFIGNNSGGGGDGGGNKNNNNNNDAIRKLETLAHQGYRACVEALELGLYNQCVTLSSSTCVLLEDLIPYRGQNTYALQSSVLMLAVQSLFCALRAPNPSQEDTIYATKKTFRLHLASKLLKKAQEKAAQAGPSARRVLTPAILIMYLEIASLQGNYANMLNHLQALSQLDTPLTKPQVSIVVQATLTAPPNIKSAACTALFNISTSSEAEAGATALPMELLGEFLSLAQGSKQKLQVIKEAIQFRTTTDITNTTPTGCTADGTADGIGGMSNNSGQPERPPQHQLLLEHQYLAAEAYTTGVSYAESDPRNAIPFFMVARDLDINLRQLCDTALGKVKVAAAKQPPSPPLIERPKKKKMEKEEKMPVMKLVAPPDAVENGINKNKDASSCSPLPPLVIDRLGSAEKENGGFLEVNLTKECFPLPEQEQEAVQEEENTNNSSKMKNGRNKDEVKTQPGVEDKATKEAPPAPPAPSPAAATTAVSPPSRSALASLTSLPPKTKIFPSKVLATQHTSPLPAVSKRNEKTSSLLMPSARKHRDDADKREHPVKRQKKEATDATTAAPAAPAVPAVAPKVSLPPPPPPSRPLLRDLATQQKVPQQQKQQKQSSAWLSSMLSAQNKAFNNAFEKSGTVGSTRRTSGGHGGALPPVNPVKQQRQRASSFLPPRPLNNNATKTVTFNVPDPVPAQDTADALSLDSDDLS